MGMKINKSFKNVPSTCVSDALNGMNNMDISIKPLKERYQAAGPARTVQMAAGDNQVVLKAIRHAKPGDILVIDAKGDTYRAVAGDFVLGMAKTMGVQAVVVDGAIRDIAGVKELDLPVFCKGTTVAAGAKNDAGEIDVPISCGGVPVKTGDIIVADVDGVVVVPEEDAEQVLDRALTKIRKDEEREAQVAEDRDKVIAYLDKVLGNS